MATWVCSCCATNNEEGTLFCYICETPRSEESIAEEVARWDAELAAAEEAQREALRLAREAEEREAARLEAERLAREAEEAARLEEERLAREEEERLAREAEERKRREAYFGRWMFTGRLLFFGSTILFSLVTILLAVLLLFVLDTDEPLRVLRSMQENAVGKLASVGDDALAIFKLLGDMSFLAALPPLLWELLTRAADTLVLLGSEFVRCGTVILGHLQLLGVTFLGMLLLMWEGVVATFATVSPMFTWLSDRLTQFLARVADLYRHAASHFTRI